MYLRCVEVSVQEAKQTRVGKEVFRGVPQHIVKSDVGQLGQQLPVLEVGSLKHNTAMEVEGVCVLAREVVYNSVQRMETYAHIMYMCTYIV